MVGIFVLVIATLSYLSRTIVTERSHFISKDETRAAQMAARLVEQIQLLKVKDVNPSTLRALNLIDTNSTASPYSFSDIPLDYGTQYSPSQVLRQGTGRLTMATMANGSIRVLATINWRSTSGRARSYTTGTIIGAYR